MPFEFLRVLGLGEMDVLQKSNNCGKNSHDIGRRMRLWVGMVFLAGCGLAFAAEGQGVASRYDLKACVALALEASASVQAAEADVQIARAQLSQARAARVLPKFDLTWVVGPSPEARGDALNGETDLGSLRLFTRTEASFIQPLFTFGKLDAAQDAASSGVDAREAGVQKSQADLVLTVSEAYYGLILANQLWELAEEARGEIQKARKTVEEKLEEDEDTDFTYTDLARIDRFMYDVEENANKVAKERALVASALRMLLGLAPTDSMVLADEYLKQTAVEIHPLEAYLEQAESRADLRQLRAVIDVRAALARVERSEFFPQLFLGGQFKYSYAPNRDDQKSPFARDDFNFLQAGAVIGFRQSLAFGATSAKVQRARLEHQKLLYQERLVRDGVRLEVEKAYRTLLEAQANIEEAGKAVKATRRWFIAARDGFNAGLEEAGELIDAVKEYGIIRGKRAYVIFAFNRALGVLQKATGTSISYQE